MPHVTKQGSIVDQGGYTSKEPKPEAEAALKKSLRGLELTEQEQLLAVEAEEAKEAKGGPESASSKGGRESTSTKGAPRSGTDGARASGSREKENPTPEAAPEPKATKSLGKQNGHKDR